MAIAQLRLVGLESGDGEVEMLSAPKLGQR
jgi:hypothetical protein